MKSSKHRTKREREIDRERETHRQSETQRVSELACVCINLYRAFAGMG